MVGRHLGLVPVLGAAALAGCTFGVDSVTSRTVATFDETGWTLLRAHVPEVGDLTVRGDAAGEGVTATAAVAGLVSSGSAEGAGSRVAMELTRNGDRVDLSVAHEGAASERYYFDGVELIVPRAVSLDLRTGSNDVAVLGMAGDVRVETDGGSMDVTTEGDVALLSESGSQSATARGGTFSTGSGYVDARVAAATDVHTSTGQVTVTLDGPGFESLAVTTDTGDIYLDVPMGVGFYLDFKTGTGFLDLDVGASRVDSSGEEDRTSWQMPVNGGGPDVVVRTAEGALTVREY